MRRLQHPVKPFAASTIHKCIDDDVPFLATKIATSNPAEKKMFKLWEKNQLLVIISRVRELKHLTFIDPKEITLQTIKKNYFQHQSVGFFVNKFVENLAATCPSTTMLT